MSIRNIARGFTLVELLVVISIIGILAAMLLPAVQASREAGYRTQCKNNIRNLAQACQQHESQQGHFPTGGWGWQWAGEPDRGFHKQQPGGWMFNILPYIEETALHEMGKGLSNPEKRKAGQKRAGAIISIFGCPSRRRQDQYSYINHPDYNNIDRPQVVGKSDYAASGGSVGFSSDGQAAGPALTYLTRPDNQIDGQCSAFNLKADGIVFTRSEIKSAHIRDGLSKTYLLGERYLHVLAYDSDQLPYNNQGWDSGYDWDVNRWTKNTPEFDLNLPNSNGAHGEVFGSAHLGAVHMAMTDGSVHSVDYLINATVHKALGSRAGRELVDASQWIVE